MNKASNTDQSMFTNTRPKLPPKIVSRDQSAAQNATQTPITCHTRPKIIAAVNFIGSKQCSSLESSK